LLLYATIRDEGDKQGGVFTQLVLTGWMMDVASMPDKPPLKNGFTAFHTGCCFVCSAMGFVAPPERLELKFTQPY